MADACRNCDLCIKSTNVVLGIGNDTADIMVIGEAPSYSEDKSGIPFTSTENKYLKGLLANNYITEQNAFFTYVVKCRPPNRAPDNKEIAICVQTYLSRELTHIKPMFIIPVGKLATAICTGLNLTMRQANGKLYKVGKSWVYPIYSPTFILNNDYLKDEYENTIKDIGVKIRTTLDTNIWDNIGGKTIKPPF